MIPAVYVHIPFCAKKCSYCDFVSFPGRLGEADEYISRVLDEAKARKAEYGIDGMYSLYLGGGTPSLLGADQLKRLAGGLFALFPPQPGAEITLEANPGTLKPGFLQTARELGFNRLSLGVQAKQDRLLELLGRIHRFGDAVEAVKLAREAGFENISCDVMNELPGQTEADITETLTAIMTLGVKHISCYGLILEEGTPLERRAKAGEVSLPDEETVRKLNLCAADALEEAGFMRYEISNYSLPGYESRHNLVYWTGGDYLGLGCAAHSFMRGERFCNPDLDGYMLGKTRTERSLVTPAGKLEEAVMLETRLTRGIDLERIERRFGKSAVETLCKNAGKYPDLTKIEPSYLRLSKNGLMVQNAIVLELLNGIND